MVRWLSSVVLATSVFTTLVSAAAPTCSETQKCPSQFPCCSRIPPNLHSANNRIRCIGSFCLGGCDPRFSATIDSCMPAPQCVNKTYTFENISQSLADYNTYLGDSKSVGWTYSGYPLQYGSNLLLTMPANSAGTVIMSTNYVWYGQVSATIKTARDQGVITAFMSDVKDEIDFEFVGKDLATGQSNIYWEALPYYGNSGNLTGISDTFANWHTYTVDWQPDQITWAIDGVVKRTKTRASTWNATSGLYNYPQTPSRIQLSVWPGGASSQAQGTIDWAGGPINWSSTDIQQSGYYYAQVQKIDVKCYAPPAGTPKDGSGGISYIYDTKSTVFLNNSIMLSDKGTVLKSQLGSGTNTTAAPSGTATAAASDPLAGSNGGGSAEGSRGGSGSGSSSSSSSSSGSGGTSFSQGNGGTSEASIRGVSKLVTMWSVMIGLFVGGIFTLL